MRASSSLVLLAWLASASVGAWEVVDDRGVTVSAEEPAARVLALSPHLVELIYSAGAGDALVGVVEFSDHPEAARSLTRVGDAFRLDQERIAALAPDLVFAWGSGNPQVVIDDLESKGLTVIVLRTDRLDDIARHIELIGEVMGTRARSTQVAGEFRDRLAKLRYEGGPERDIDVFFQISGRPLYTIGGDQYLTEVVELCGGRNVFDDLSDAAPVVGQEAVLARNPEVIIAPRSPALDEAWEQRWRRWPSLAAAVAGNLFTVDADTVSRPTMRLLDGAAEICSVLRTARARLLVPQP